MKLFIIAALVAVAAAGRLEHLERSYLPPNNAMGSARSFGSNGGFGSPSSHGSFGSPMSHGSFGSNSGASGTAGAGLQRQNAGVSFAGATSNQYLPPNQRSSAPSGAPQFGGSNKGFGAQNFRSQQYNRPAAPTQDYAIPSTQYGSPQANQQSAATSRQYLAPRTSSFQNSPQQAFDEQTGYQYGAPQGASSNFRSQQYNRQAAPTQQYSVPNTQYGTPQATSSISGSRYQAQFPQQSGATSRQYLAPSSQSSSFGAPGSENQSAATSRQYLAPSSQYSQTSSFAPNSQSQSAATSRQYLAPRTSSFQNPPQQAFDEQTGYQY